MTATLFHIEQYQHRGVVRAAPHILLGKVVAMKSTGTYGPEQRGPARAAAADPQNNSATRPQDSTPALPTIRIKAPTKAWIPDGDYSAVCTEANYKWTHRFRRWEAVCKFECDHEDGVDLLANITVDPYGGISGDNWLGQTLRKFRTTDLSKLEGHEFIVTVGTVKSRRRTHDEVEDGVTLPDRARSDWYSKVRRARLVE